MMVVAASRLLKQRAIIYALVILFHYVAVPSSRAQNVQKQKIALQSPSGNFLQCSCSTGADGTLHANNRKINQEEAWWLWTVGDPTHHQVALANYRNGYFMWRHGGGSTNHRARVIHDITGESTWTMISGADYGLPADYVAFRAYDGAFLKAWNGGGGSNAPGEGGEVYVDNGPPNRDIHWVGWWHMGEVTWDPQSGPNVWTSIGDGAYAGLKWVGNAIAYAFVTGPSPAQPTTPTAPAPIACNALPPVTYTGTDNYIHAFCEGVMPSDYSGHFYSQNETYATRRVQCDIEAHHRDQPTHSVITQVCSSTSRSTVGCEAVP